MTMHLVGPWLSTTGKRKSKRKFRTAAGAAQARELQESWQGLLSQHGIKAAANSRRKKTDFEPMKRAPLSYRGSDQPRIPSLPFTGEACTVGEQRSIPATRSRASAPCTSQTLCPSSQMNKPATSLACVADPRI